MADEDAPIGIICAIPEEIGHFGDAFDAEREETCAGFRFYCGRLEGVPTVLVEGGMGKVNAGLVATLLSDRFGCRALVFSGVAGGVDPHLGIGDVVIAERLVQHDYGVLQSGRVEPYQPGHLPFFMPTEQLGYHPPQALLDRVRDALADMRLPPLSAAAAGGAVRHPAIHFGTVLTGDSFLSCIDTRNRLFASLNGQAVEMEGAAVAQVAERFAIPCLVIRSLSDMAGEENDLDFLAFLQETASYSAAVLRRLITVL